MKKWEKKFFSEISLFWKNFVSLLFTDYQFQISFSLSFISLIFSLIVLIFIFIKKM